MILPRPYNFNILDISTECTNAISAHLISWKLVPARTLIKIHTETHDARESENAQHKGLQRSELGSAHEF